MDSWKGRGNQYIQLLKVLYCKLPTNGKQLPAFPLEVGPGTEPRSQRWEARVLPLCHCGPHYNQKAQAIQNVLKIIPLKNGHFFCIRILPGSFLECNHFFLCSCPTHISFGVFETDKQTDRINENIPKHNFLVEVIEHCNTITVFELPFVILCTYGAPLQESVNWVIYGNLH